MVTEFVKKYIGQRLVAAGVAAFFILIVIVISGSISPADFKSNTIVSLPKDTTLNEAASILKEKGIIKSSFFFKSYVYALAKGKIIAGTYKFEKPRSALGVAQRISSGNYGLERVKVTIPEGSDTKDIAWILLNKLGSFDARAFLAKAASKEGYLFPDTYFFYENDGADVVIESMETVFNSRMHEAMSEYGGYSPTSTVMVMGKKRSMDDVITMASILEREAANAKDRMKVAGILWKRLDAGMPLQVDAAFWYLYRKTSSQLTVDDLKSNSPYNTYTRKGLPPTPISNPGIEAINDAMNPQVSSYWYYLSDPKGGMHYAATFAEHSINKDTYLR